MADEWTRAQVQDRLESAVVREVDVLKEDLAGRHLETLVRPGVAAGRRFAEVDGPTTIVRPGRLQIEVRTADADGARTRLETTATRSGTGS